MTDKEVIDWVERNRHNNLDNYVFDPKLKRVRINPFFFGQTFFFLPGWNASQ